VHKASLCPVLRGPEFYQRTTANSPSVRVKPRVHKESTPDFAAPPEQSSEEQRILHPHTFYLADTASGLTIARAGGLRGARDATRGGARRFHKFQRRGSTGRTRPTLEKW
jgi:hypothetical protein